MSNLITVPADYLARLEQKLDSIQAYIETNYESRSKWLTTEQAMNMIGCKKSKLSLLRISGKLIWRHNGQGRGVMIDRRSVEQFIKSQTMVSV